jgi:hypothetical protein
MFRLDNTKREDMTLIAFQIWVMSMSVVALLNESIPHIFAALVTQFLVAVWTIQQIFETESFRNDFVRLTVNGACSGHNLLGYYWSNRKNAEIASAVLNIVDVFLIAFFTYKLVKACDNVLFPVCDNNIFDRFTHGKLTSALALRSRSIVFISSSSACPWLFN